MGLKGGLGGWITSFSPCLRLVGCSDPPGHTHIFTLYNYTPPSWCGRACIRVSQTLLVLRITWPT